MDRVGYVQPSLEAANKGLSVDPCVASQHSKKKLFDTTNNA